MEAEGFKIADTQQDNWSEGYRQPYFLGERNTTRKNRIYWNLEGSKLFGDSDVEEEIVKISDETQSQEEYVQPVLPLPYNFKKEDFEFSDNAEVRLKEEKLDIIGLIKYFYYEDGIEGFIDFENEYPILKYRGLNKRQIEEIKMFISEYYIVELEDGEVEIPVLNISPKVDKDLEYYKLIQKFLSIKGWRNSDICIIFKKDFPIMIFCDQKDNEIAKKVNIIIRRLEDDNLISVKRLLGCQKIFLK